MNKKAYVVAASYTSECCSSPHVWLKVVLAHSEVEAIAAMARSLRRKQYAQGDIVSLPLADAIATTRRRTRAATLERHRAADPHCTCPDCIAFHAGLDSAE